MNSLQLKKERQNLVTIMKPLASKHSLTNEERVRWTSLEKDLRQLDYKILIADQENEINRLEAERRGNPGSDLRNYSLSRAIHLVATGKKLDGLELEMHQEAEKENKELGFAPVRGIGFPSKLRYLPLQRASSGQSVTTAADGGNLKQEEPLLFIDGLRNALVLPGLGARFLSGLVGDVPISIGGSFTASWMAEDGESTVGKMTLSKKTLTPKRIQSVGALSYQLLRQSSIDVESMVQKSIIDSIAQAIQTAALNGSGVAPEPRGILNTVGIGSVAGGDNGLAPTWGHITKLETEVAQDNALYNAKYAAYLTNAMVRGKLKSTFKNATYGDIPVWDKGAGAGSGELNGYPAVVTNAMPSNLTKGSSSGVCSAILFGLWDQLYMGQWGGYDIIVDPYTLSDKAESKITVITYADSLVGHPEAFAAMVDALTV